MGIGYDLAMRERHRANLAARGREAKPQQPAVGRFPPRKEGPPPENKALREPPENKGKPAISIGKPELPEGVTPLGGGWYEFPDGKKRRGAEAAAEIEQLVKG